MDEPPDGTSHVERSAVLSDFAAVDEAATLAFCRLIFAEEGWPLEFMDPAIGAGFDRLRDVFLLATQDGAILGCAALKELTPDEALLTRMLVASAHRGTGLAQTLFGALLARARELGYAWVVLDVNRESGRAIRFYEKQGMERFVPVPRPRWLESAPEELQYAHYFRQRV